MAEEREDPEELIGRFCAEITAHKEPYYLHRNPEDFPTGKVIVEAAVEDRPGLLRRAMGQAARPGKGFRYALSRVLPGVSATAGDAMAQMMLKSLIGKLLRAKLAAGAGDVGGLLELGARGAGRGSMCRWRRFCGRWSSIRRIMS